MSAFGWQFPHPLLTYLNCIAKNALWINILSVHGFGYPSMKWVWCSPRPKPTSCSALWTKPHHTTFSFAEAEMGYVKGLDIVWVKLLESPLMERTMSRQYVISYDAESVPFLGTVLCFIWCNAVVAFIHVGFQHGVTRTNKQCSLGIEPNPA